MGVGLLCKRWSQRPEAKEADMALSSSQYSLSTLLITDSDQTLCENPGITKLLKQAEQVIREARRQIERFQRAKEHEDHS